MSLAMPFIDNDLLWSSDHDGKMVDLSSCLQDASVPDNQQTPMGLGELSQSDLSTYVPQLQEANIADDEIFKHLSDTIETVDAFVNLNELSPTLFIKQEENNNIPNCTANDPTGSSLLHQKSAQVMLEMRSSLKFTIAAANPILAEKLATPSEQSLQVSNSASRLQMAPLTPKVEKGELTPDYHPTPPTPSK